MAKPPHLPADPAHKAFIIAFRAIISFASALFVITGQAQSYSIDWHTIGSGGTSTGGVYSLSGTIGRPDAGTMSGGGYTLAGGYWVPGASVASPVSIFDNTSGSVNGGVGVGSTAWLAGKFLLGSQSYGLESLSLLLNSQDGNGSAGPPCAVQLHIYSHNPANGKPAADTGVIMNLSGLTNPITLLNGQQLVKWIPATPFTLLTNTTYWAVLGAEDGKRMGWIASFTQPLGDAGTLGETRSTDAGATWGTPFPGDNFKMLIQGTTVPDSPALEIAAVAIAGKDLRFSFLTSAGRSYLLESRDELASGVWAEVPGTTSPGSGGTLQVTISNAFGQPRQFYRVKQSP
jgi:hypothetical protein